jgi:hypothetical protein
MDGVSYGKMRVILQNRNDKELFVPFINKLREGNDTSEDVEEVEEPKKKRGKK